jgi:uncharacterized protein (DUF2345 family)
MTATPPNRDNDRAPDIAEGQGNLKTNYTAICYGNDHGSISFGHIHKPGDCTADILLQASDGRHSIALDKDGERKGSTQITAPGRISIQSGEDKEEAEDTLFINALNGNICIIASNGKIRLQGIDIELVAVGEGGSKGNIQITAAENIKLDAEQIHMNGKSVVNILTPGTMEMAANSCLKIYASVVRGVSDGCAFRTPTNGGKDYYDKCTSILA